jgi:hypothetical protein
LLAYQRAERPMPGAPIVAVDDQHHCVPQHFLEYQHNIESIEEVISDIHFSDKYPIFVCEDAHGIYVQIGVIGHDNYKPNHQNASLKIVYGRKWRIETNLPSSEIIQTVFLALQKAREHEIRELFRLQSRANSKQSTPFSGHHDIPFLARKLKDNAPKDNSEEPDSAEVFLRSCLSRIEFNAGHLSLKTVQHCVNGHYMIEMSLPHNKDAHIECDLPEFLNQDICILLSELSENALHYAIMDALLKLSDIYIEDNFEYRSFARFSRKVDISEIGEVSIALRNNELMSRTEAFKGDFEDINYETDATRVPVLQISPRNRQLITQLQQYPNLKGQIPQLA